MCGGDPGSLKGALKKDGLGTGGLSTALYATRKTNSDIVEGARDKGVLPEKKVPIDPEAERAAAAASAATQANARIAFQRKAQRENSLITGGGAAASGSGRATLGV